MTIARRSVWLGVVLAMAGCQSRLNIDQTYQIAAGSIQTLTIDPPRYDQKVAVTVTTDAPVTATLFLKSEASAVEKDLERGQKSDKALASWNGDGTGTLDGTVPAKQSAVLRIDAGPKAANVKIKIAGK